MNKQTIIEFTDKELTVLNVILLQTKKREEGLFNEMLDSLTDKVWEASEESRKRIMGQIVIKEILDTFDK